MKIKTETWKLFKLGDIFEIKKGKRLTSYDQIDGNTPYIGAISINNGLSNYIGQEAIHEGNTISLSYNGSVGEAFYQPYPFWATDDVNVLYFKKENNFHFNQYIALYICTVLKKEKYRYCYGRKWILSSMNDTKILLPSKNGYPDWQYMENYIKSLRYKSISTKNNNKERTAIDFSKWEYFKISDIFDKPKINKYSKIPESGTYNFVSSTSLNNGIAGSSDTYDFEQPCITVSTNGACFDCFYHNEKISISSDVEILTNKFLNQYNGLFLCSVLEKEKYRWNYGRKPKSNKVFETKILLPSKNGYPDWQYMENYIKSMPFGDRI